MTGISARKAFKLMFCVAALTAVLLSNVSCSAPPNTNDPDIWYEKSKLLPNMRWTDENLEWNYDLIRKAADNGDVDAMYATATSADLRISQEDKKYYMLKAAERKQHAAQSNLARYYLEGYQNYEKDPAKALYWKQRVACDNTSDSHIHRELGDLYSGKEISNINGRPIDPELRRLAEINLPLAYAHYSYGHFLMDNGELRDAIEEKMTEAEVEQGKSISNKLSNGGCPYGNRI